MMKRCLSVLAGLVWLAAASPSAWAGPQVVIELFTSQGCSSCPPADAMLDELARRPGVIALTLPVDYWDYLGWKDTLAQPAFSARQRAYAGGRGDRQVFTPQMIVNGKAPCLGSDRAKLERLIDEAGRVGLSVPVNLSEKGSTVSIEVGGAAAEGPVAAQIWLLPVAQFREVTIARGENRGRTFTYANVVRGITRLGEWDGRPARLDVPLEVARRDAEGYVVILQAVDGGTPGVILGAAKSPRL